MIWIPAFAGMGRLSSENKIIDATYITEYTYDGVDRLKTVTYPTTEVVTQNYNGRGLPQTLTGSQAGDLVDNTLYNNLGSTTQINLHNGLTTYFGYWVGILMRRSRLSNLC
jgi:YD repeat-containing protein